MAPTDPGNTLSRADELIKSLELAHHPEGGFYREIFRSPEAVTPADGRGSRSALTAIYFLLPAGAISRWHRVRSDECWQYCEGAPLELLQSPDLSQVHHSTLAAESPFLVVPAGHWQAARSLGDYTLVICTVAPGFEFADFELRAGDPPFRGGVADTS